MKLFISTIATTLLLASAGIASASTHQTQDRCLRPAVYVLEYTGHIYTPLTSDEHRDGYSVIDEYNNTATGGPSGGLPNGG